ncbi:MAG TPA: PAS domain S-box protein [Chthoniobacter sp.]
MNRTIQATGLLVAAGGAAMLVGEVFHLPALAVLAPGWAATVLTVGLLIWSWARAAYLSERRIAHRERLYQVLSQCNQSIVHITEREPLFARICEIAVELGKFRMAWIGLADDETQMVRPVSHAGAGEGFFETVKVSLRDEPLGHGPGATSLREGRTVISNDMQHDARMASWRSETANRGFRAAAGFPISCEGKIVGCFVLYAGEPNFFDEAEVKLLEEMAGDISFALTQMERDAQRRRFETERDRLAAELQMILDTVPAMIFYKDLQHRVVRANAAMLRALGKSLEEVVGRTAGERGSRFDDKYTRDEDEILASGQPMLGFLEPVDTPNGVRWMQTDKVPQRDATGKITGIIGLGVDITERKLAEEALKAREADFRASFCSTAVGQVQADALTGRYLRVNPRFCEITGYSEEELLGMTFRDLTHPDDRESDTDAHQRMLAGEIDELSREKRYRRKDGRAVWVSINASIIRDDAGRPLRTLAVIRDITGRRAAEEAKQAAEDKYRTLVEQSLMGIYIIQDDGFVYVNPMFAQIMGRTAEELTAGRIFDFVVEEDREMVAANLRKRLESNLDSVRYGLRMVRKDGFIVHVEVQGARAEFNGRPAILGTLLDLTERKKIEAQLLQSQKMEAVGQLAGGIAHDFNNLLTAITGNTKLALEDLAPDSPVRAYLAEIGKAGSRAVDLVRRILTFSRQKAPERKLLELQPVVEEALKLLRASLPAMIEIRTTYVAGAPPVLADGTQIHQVLMNLGANATHAMGDRGLLEVRESVIDVDADVARTSPELRVGRYVHLAVSDTGCGMDRETLARIFDPFFTTKSQSEGTGLGLSVVHGIMKAHGGAITVYSEPGRGTVFHLYFPAMEGTVASVQAPARPVPKGSGERILYVDDEEPLVYLTTQVLSRLGYKVTGFVESEAALRCFLQDPHQFDAVITDLSMPRLSGRDLAARFLKVRPDVPIILASGYIRPEDSESARQLGVRDLILKPDTVEDLGRVLHRILSERRMAKVDGAPVGIVAPQDSRQLGARE